MLKIVIDTNVIVSALIEVSYPTQIVRDLVLGKKIVVCLSQQVLSEYINVINRDKFKRYPSFTTYAQIVLSTIEEISLKYNPTLTLDTIQDEPDNRFLELALASDADFLITGNTKDFVVEKPGALKIVTPKEFIVRFWDRK
jgi:putative PIN family toxin of toxin-antitoxin system